MRTLLFIWQLPQCLLARIILRFTGRAMVRQQWYWATVHWLDDHDFGISLGDTIIVSSEHHDETTVMHEYGHCRQSQMLGPLYLLVVGLPSITMNILSRIDYARSKKTGKPPTFAMNYYNRWPENWADKLGGVQR